MMTQNQSNQIQIFVAKTNKNIFEAMDWLEIGKVRLNLVDYASNPTVFVSHNINADVLKVLAHDIINGKLENYTEYKGSAKSKRADNKPEARVLKISKRSGENIKYPYTITIEVGEGQVIGQGAVKMVKKEQSVTIHLSDMDMKRFAVTVGDYIRNYELWKQFKELEKGQNANTQKKGA